MTDLNRLKVSLTKHNAHKVARLLKDGSAAEVLNRLHEVHADAAQARKNLSASSGDKLPPVWESVQSLGPDAVDALVLVGIVFSHGDLIKAMAGASDRDGFLGRIDRGRHLEGKAYTNFARIIDQLGYAAKVERRGIAFNLKGMFEIPGLGPLVGELLELKLMDAGWDRSNSFLDEATRLSVHDIFGVAPDELKAWFLTGTRPPAAAPTLSARDQQFFEDVTEGPSRREFVFRSGHAEREVEPVERAASAKSRANRLHNEIQNKLYAYLKAHIGAANVGTELETGSGTSVDVATKRRGKITFYEIKTGASVRSSIRQALPQLLEYAFWPDQRRADELTIVSHLPLTRDSDLYIQFLRSQFKMPITYRQFDLERGKLC